MKLSLVICLILFLASCSSDEVAEQDSTEKETLATEPTSTQVGIDVQGLDKIDYTDAVALSSNVEEEININGIFENPYTHNGIEDLPVLITKEEVLLYGYFPHTLKSNKVTIDDILLFYFLIYPQIAIQGPDYNLLLNEIKNYSNYEDLKNMLINNLNNNQPPVLDDNFLNLIREFSTTISPENYSKTSAKSKSKEVVGEFKFNYDRNGKIEWQEQTPLYSTMGFVVKDVSKKEIVFGPELLKTKSIQSAVTNWFLNTFVTDIKPLTNSFTLTDNGEYEILLTNGHSLNTELDLAINDKNAKIFASKSLGLVLASGAKTLVGNSKCKEALAEHFAKEMNFFIGLDRDSAAYPTNDEWVTHMRSAAAQAFTIVGECSTEGIGKKFFKFLGSAIVAFVNTPTDIAEIILLEIDYFNSEIAILETRYFENGLSFGKLSTTQISQSNYFQGNEGDSFEFAFLVGEESVKYDVTRTTFSDFIPIETFSNVQGIPFNIEVKSGDAAIQASPVYSLTPTLAGNLIIPITLGCSDSEIIISPAFSFNEIEDYIIETKTNQEIELGGNFDFGEVNIKATTFPTRQLTIHNPSCNPITVSSISLPDAFNSNWSGGILAPLETKVVTITFNPTKAGNYSGTLTVNNNVDQGNNSFGISGIGTDYIEVTYISHERIEGSPEGFYYATVSIDRGINGALADNVFTRVAINGGGGGSGAGYDPTNPKSVEFFKDYPVIFSGGGVSVPFYLTINGGWGEVLVFVRDPGPPSVSGGVSFRL